MLALGMALCCQVVVWDIETTCADALRPENVVRQRSIEDDAFKQLSPGDPDPGSGPANGSFAHRNPDKPWILFIAHNGLLLHNRGIMMAEDYWAPSDAASGIQPLLAPLELPKPYEGRFLGNFSGDFIPDPNGNIVRHAWIQPFPNKPSWEPSIKGFPYPAFFLSAPNPAGPP